MNADETWLPVPGYPGYEVSDHGRVRSVDRQVQSRWGTPKTLRGKILSQSLVGSDGGRYWSSALFREGKRRTATVHTLVLEAFVGPRPVGMWGLHRDDNRDNNNLRNLYWGTPSQNVRDKIRNGNHHESNKTHCPQGHEYTPENTGRRPGTRANERACITCRRARDRERYHSRKRAAADGS